MNYTVGSDRASAPNWVIAMPVGNAPTRALDDGDKRHQVPGVEDRVSHDVSAATGHEIVAVTIAPGIIALHALAEGRERFAVLILINAPMRGGEHDGVFQIGTMTYMNWTVIQQRHASIANQEIVED